MKALALADIKPGASPLLAEQAAHPLLPAPLIATGPHHRPQLESGAGDEKLFASHDLLLRGPSPGIK